MIVFSSSPLFGLLSGVFVAVTVDTSFAASVAAMAVVSSERFIAISFPGRIRSTPDSCRQAGRLRRRAVGERLKPLLKVRR